MNMSVEEVELGPSNLFLNSSGDPDGLRPQHLKDITGLVSGEGNKQSNAH